MATIDQLTLAAVLDAEMLIPVNLFGQTLKIKLGQLLAAQNSLTIVQYSADGADGSWHADLASGDKFVRISLDGGNSWGPAINLHDPDAQPQKGEDGKTYYTWMKFADTATPQTAADIYDIPTEKTTAIGWAYNKSTPNESDDPSDYTWTRFKGADAVELDTVQEYYAVGASSTLPPTDGWVEVPKNAMPAMTAAKPYLWNYERSTYNNGAYRDTQPRCVGRRGDDGTSITKVTDYYLASAKETGVTTADDGWTTLIASAEASWGVELPYLWNYEKREWSNGYVDYVQPHRIARWASDGASGQGSVNSYVFCLSEKQPATPTGGSYTDLVPDGWSDGFPADPEDDNFGLSVWMSRRLFTSDGLPPQDPEWTEPALFGNNSHQQVMFSTSDEQPPSPAVDESAWDDEASRDTVWMATRYRVNSLKNPGWSDWSIIRIKGEKGEDGKDGVSITKSSTTYSTVHTESKPDDSTFTLNDVPVLTPGQWLWSKQEINYSTGESTKTYSVSRIGANGAGVSVKSTSVTYAKSTTASQPADSQFIYSSIDGVGIGLGDYLWTKSTTIYTDGKSMTSYSVSRIGSDGANGQSIQGPKGDTYYVHIAYCDSIIGSLPNPSAVTGFSTTATANSAYLGTCTDRNELDPTDHTKYKWAKIKGDAVTVSNTSVRYSTANTASRPADSTFTLSDPPTLSSGQYLWSRTTVTYSDGKATNAYAVSRIGENGLPGSGVTISSSTITYAKTKSNEQPTDSQFIYSSITAAQVEKGDWLWSKQELRYSDGTITRGYTVSRIGTDGSNGEGIPGTSNFIHYAYATSANGVTGFSTVAYDDAVYIGVCVTDSEPDPTDPAAYEWSRFKGLTAVLDPNTNKWTHITNPSQLQLSATVQKFEAIEYDASLAVSEAATAKQDANTAKTNATTALSNANTANTNARAAADKADTAKTTADTAKTTADTAKSTADTAKSTADTASSNASWALSTATQSSKDASTALNKATSVEKVATTANENATSALDKATSALNTAESKATLADVKKLQLSDFTNLKSQVASASSLSDLSATVNTNHTSLLKEVNQKVSLADVEADGFVRIKNNSSKVLEYIMLYDTDDGLALSACGHQLGVSYEQCFLIGGGSSSGLTESQVNALIKAYASPLSHTHSQYLTSAALADYITADEASNRFQTKGNYALASTLSAYATQSWIDSQNFFKYRGAVPTAFIDLTAYTANASGYANYAPGTYTIQRSGYSQLFVNLAANTGSCSALQFYTGYNDTDNLWFRKTIDSNRISGAWVPIITPKNIGNYAITSHQSLAGCAKLQSANDFVHAGNEWTVIPDGYSGSILWLNWRAGANGTASSFTQLNIGNGTKGGFASVRANSFIVADGYSIAPGSTSHRMTTPYGYVDIGPMNAMYAHIYTDRPSFYFNKPLLVNGGTVWHSGNDGSGSGLDADLLDGNHASRFLECQGYNNARRIFVMGDPDKYYPVVISKPTTSYPATLLNISRRYNDTAPDSWYTSTHKGGLTLSLLYNGSRYWDGNGTGSPGVVSILMLYQNYCYMVGGIGSATGGLVVWLRGGNASYYIHSDLGTEGLSVSIYYDTYTDGAKNIFPVLTSPRDYSALRSLQVNVAGNANTASQLQTARTIWGQSFNGTGNVDGLLKIQANAGNYCEGIRIKPIANWSTIVLGGPDLTADTGTSAKTWSIHNNNGNFYINNNASDSQKATRLWGHANGWTIGNSSTSSYALNAASFICDSWVRTIGGTGWYNETHKGGIYMSDSSWIRIWNNKGFYGGTAIIRTDGTLQVGDNGKWFSASSSGATVLGNTVWHAGNFNPANYLPLSGGTITGTLTVNGNISTPSSLSVQGNISIAQGLLTVKTGATHTGIKVGNTYISAIDGRLIFQNNAEIRFGGDSWNYDIWAGLKYDHASKHIYLGLTDGSIFTAYTSPQSGGSIFTPGISAIYVGNNRMNEVWHAGNLNPANFVAVSASSMASLLNAYTLSPDSLPTFTMTPGSVRVVRLLHAQNGSPYAGYDTRVDIGLQSYAAWSRPSAFLRVGSNDSGTTWATFTFGSNGNFTSNSAVIGNLNLAKSGNQPYLYATQGQIYLQNATSYIDAESEMWGFQYHTSSDQRLKNVTRHIAPSVIAIASARAVEFDWLRNGRHDCGCIAQDWQDIIPWVVVTDKYTGMLSMDYGKAALISAISIARSVVAHESRIATLERENAELKIKVYQLESQLQTTTI